MTKKTYIARLDGKIVGKRTSERRTYTHAVVVQCDIEHSRKRAYEYVATESDKSNYEYNLEIVACEGVFVALDDMNTYGKGPSVGQRPHYNVFKNKMGAINYGAEEIADAKRKTKDGWDGYVALCRAKAIESFETAVKDGGFEPHPVTWCGRPDLAQKEVAKRQKGKYAGWYNVKNIWIVDAEEVVK